MAALDTNVVVRLLVGDDPRQAAAAEALVAAEPCTVATTVLMECEWVLRGAYGLDRATIVDLLTGLFGLEHVDAQEPGLVAQALDAFAAGLDLADAVHVLASRPERFATFDRALQRRAARLGWPHVTGLTPPDRPTAAAP